MLTLRLVRVALPVIVMLGLSVIATPTMAQTGFNQPRMQEALSALYAARESLEAGHPTRAAIASARSRRSIAPSGT